MDINAALGPLTWECGALLLGPHHPGQLSSRSPLAIAIATEWKLERTKHSTIDSEGGGGLDLNTHSTKVLQSLHERMHRKQHEAYLVVSAGCHTTGLCKIQLPLPGQRSRGSFNYASFDLILGGLIIPFNCSLAA